MSQTSEKAPTGEVNDMSRRVRMMESNRKNYTEDSQVRAWKTAFGRHVPAWGVALHGRGVPCPARSKKAWLGMRGCGGLASLVRMQGVGVA